LIPDDLASAIDTARGLTAEHRAELSAALLASHRVDLARVEAARADATQEGKPLGLKDELEIAKVRLAILTQIGRLYVPSVVVPDTGGTDREAAGILADYGR
jgi:hypothetical protein